MVKRIDPALLPSADERELVGELTRDVLGCALPEEVRLFEGDAQAWLTGTHRAEAPREDKTAFGGGELIGPLIPYVIVGLTAAVRYVSGVLAEGADEELRPRIKGWVRRLFGHRGEQAAGVAGRLPVDLVKRVHDVTLATCLNVGLDADDAALVSDAVAGRLVVPQT